MKCVILQPSYIPWRGYFEQIAKADVFVFYDCVPYDRRGWRNRNRIKTRSGTQWLTIPVLSKGTRQVGTPIKDIHINWDRDWNHSHWETLRRAYGKAPFFCRYETLLREFYARRPTLLADFTVELTIALAAEIPITRTKFIRSSEIPCRGSKTERLLSILQHLEATHYISGPAARSYLNEDAFSNAGISMEYMEYRHLEYPQLYPPYDPNVSILDLLFMTGSDASRYLYSHPSDSPHVSSAETPDTQT